ncbi:acylphosphatase-2-like isoform X1 [Engystomops pustulosus]|uniref:acylphosphatase-2-like isoform X1 n=1 Tax=Engystomops pustulosus TaxID=76066 RepID=UPI003AFA1FD9
MASTGLWSFDYEIYGDVQGVFFRKYTEDQAKHVAVVGWVKNTPHGTVTGQVQGSKEKVEKIFSCLHNALLSAFFAFHLHYKTSSDTDTSYQQAVCKNLFY